MEVVTERLATEQKSQELVELDKQRGEEFRAKVDSILEVVNFAAVDDVGRVINPMIVEGQVHGGVAQGLGQALLENVVYDDHGQPLTGSYMDYAMPRAEDVPFYQVDHSCATPCTHNPLGVKGCGEAGAVGAIPALALAMTAALPVVAGRKVWSSCS